LLHSTETGLSSDSREALVSSCTAIEQSLLFLAKLWLTTENKAFNQLQIANNGMPIVCRSFSSENEQTNTLSSCISERSVSTFAFKVTWDQIKLKETSFVHHL